MKTYIVFVFGIDKAGKTSLVNLVKGGKLDPNITPTLAFNVEKFIYENVKFQLWDAPGQKKLRNIWQKGYERAKILMFVLDFTDKDRYYEAKGEFLNVINNPVNHGIPIIFCVNKVDLSENAVDLDEIKKYFLPDDDKYRRIFWMQTSIHNPESILILQNTFLDIVLARAKSTESFLKILDGLCHDIKNQLLVIKNFSYLLSEKEMDEESEEYLSCIDIAINQSYKLINNIKPKIEEGKNINYKTETKEILEESIRFISRGNRCKFEFDIESKIPPISLDPDIFIQIINNILINATDAVIEKGTDGLIIVSEKLVNITPGNQKEYLRNTELIIELTYGDFIQITVEDNGVGIPINKQEKLLTSNYTSKENGWGLGLPTVNSLLNDCGGFVNFKSEPMVGTTFYVYIPINKPKH